MLHQYFTNRQGDLTLLGKLHFILFYRKGKTYQPDYDRFTARFETERGYERGRETADWPPYDH